MNGPGDIPLTQGATPDRPCGLISIIPTLGMSSCRGRAEDFARKLQSKLRTLGSQNEDNISQEEEPIINGGTSNTWITPQESEQIVTNLQPLRHESDSLFDFDCEIESPGSPVDECEYLRLIESTSNTPHNSVTESGYVCNSVASSHSSSSDGPYYDPEATENVEVQVHNQQPRISGITEYMKTIKSKDISELDENNLSSNKDNANNSHKDESSSFEQHTPACSNDDHKIEIFQLSEDGSVESKAATEIESICLTQDDILTELQKQSEGNERNNGKNQGAQLSLHIPIDKELGDCRLRKDIKIEEPDLPLTKIEINEIQSLSDDTEILNSIIDRENRPTSPECKISSVLDTDDEDDCRPQRIRRCSSLKTGKTPPGTPGRKKIVRFADVLGLDLADVKTFLDEIPTIPKSAFEDLEIIESEPPIQLGPKADKLLMPLFQQPGGLPTFLDMVRDKQVSLENAAVTDHINQSITGSVRVRNLDFHKSVHIRYTIDNWRTYADLQGTYVENSCDGFSDKFTFTLFGNSLHVGQRLEFAVRFQCKGQQFWDNNFGANYCFQCLPATTQTNLIPLPPVIPSHHTNNDCHIMSPAAGDSWCGFY